MSTKNILRIGGFLSEAFCQHRGARNIQVISRTFKTTNCLELTDFQKQKILTEFDVLYDRNKDGFIDRKDIDVYKKVLYDYYSVTRGENLREAVPGYDIYWTLFTEMADANHDGKISRDEWIDIWTSISEKAKDMSFKSLPQWVRLMPHVIFPIMDYHADGVLDEEEYKTFWHRVGGLGSDSRTVTKCLNTMTEDGKYTLDMDRFENLYADFYLSKVSDSPGKYMSGPVEYD